ncbi:MAG: chitobiase/beta-hexosaminidase C-terminal domain-containing protein [Proteobacteria bacterium]|nr:chitobiase/beta-hexosaminidase C-terminal domain-containing protein [Pseudomonadota bacterium]
MVANVTTCGIIVDGGAAITSSISVNLGLICGDSTGCAEMSLSDNGVAWSSPELYATDKSWNLVANDGPRKVFVKYKNGNGDWSGACSDSIILDTTPPATTISPTGGTFMDPQSVAITASEESTIYYATDGSEPTIASNVYSGPVSVSADSTLKAFAVDMVGNTGNVVSQEYEICTGSNLSITGMVKDATTDEGMPLVTITLDSGHSTSTDINGNYSFTGLPRDYYLIEEATTASPGYVTYQERLKLCKTSVAHDIILTRDATVFGTNTNSGYSSDSVNTSTGNFVYGMADLAIPGRGMSFAFERTYNSQDGTDGPLGFGWTHNYNISLSIGGSGEVIVRWGDGRTEVWSPDGGGGFTPMYGVFSTLIDNGDSTFTLRQKDMIEYRFNIANQISEIVDEYGNTITFNYSGSELTSITDTVGRTISFTYDANSRITSILDPISRSVTFTYDANGGLVSSANLDGKITNYTFDANHQLLTVTDPMGNVVMTNVYDSARRVVSSQKDALGGMTLYTYDVATRTTKIVDALGNISYHNFDELLRLVKETDALGYVATYVYGTSGNLDSVTDKRGNTTSYIYDPSGNVLTKNEPLGRVTSATYDAKNNPLTKTDANNNVSTFTYDPVNGNLLTATDALTNTTTYTYDAYGQFETVTDALNNVTTYEYDQFGNQTAVIDTLTNRSEFTYDGVGRKLTESHQLGRATAYEYDSMDRLISVTDGTGGVSQFAFDDNGNKLEHLDALGHKTTFTYDAKDRLVSKTDPLGNTETYTYDLLDRRKVVTNAKGATASAVYDALGNVIQATDSLGNTVRSDYDANSNKIKTIDALGNETVMAYDALNRLVSTTDALGNIATYTYDANGNQLSVTDALTNTTSSTYDVLNRLLTVTDPLNNVTTNTYDELGRLLTVTDARNNTTSFTYDELGRLVTVTDAESGVVTAAYDVLGNRISTTDTRNKVTTYEYDKLNRLVAETDPLNNRSAMLYDKLGNLIVLTDGNGTTSYVYDANNRLTQINHPGLAISTYTYDAVGNRLTATGGVGTTTFTYNSLDQVTSVADPYGKTVSYTYNPNGSRTSIRYPGNLIVFYTYDELNRLASVSDWGGVSTTYSYDVAGRLVGKAMGNGATVGLSYDDAGRLLTKEDRDPATALIAGYTYTMDEIGNRTAVDMTQPLVPLLDNYSDAFIHDDGNRVLTGTGETYTHDNQGNRTSRDDGNVVSQYDYNYDDQLTGVVQGSDTFSYQYNSDGQRLASINSGIETRYLLDVIGEMEFVLAEMDENNAVSKYYIYGDGLLYSIDGATGERLYYHYDPIGSTVAITDATATVTDKYAYLPFGELNRSETVHDNQFTYVGKFGVMQEPTGLQFMRARFYDPETRRFMSKDPVKGDMDDAQRMNLFQYGLNNPLLKLDPNGEDIVILPTIMLAAFVVSYFGPWVYIAVTGQDDVGRQLRPGGTTDAGLHSYSIQEDIDMPLKGPPQDAEDSFQFDYLNQGTSVPEGAKQEFSLGNTGNGQMVKQSKTVWGPAPKNSFTPPKSPTLQAKVEPLIDSPQNSGTFSTKKSSSPKKYLSVKSYASGYFRREFGKLLSPNFADRQTRSAIERSIDNEIMNLQTNRYGYRDKDDQKRMKEKRARDVSRASKKLYAQLTSALSKHSVIVRDISSLPKFSSGGMRQAGVYGN